MAKHILLFGKLLLTTCNQPGGAPFCDRATTVITTQNGLGLLREDIKQHARSVAIVMPWNLRRFSKSATANLPWSPRRKAHQRWFTTECMTRALVIGLVRSRREMLGSPFLGRCAGGHGASVDQMERAMDLQADAAAPHVDVGAPGVVDGYLKQDKVGPAYIPYRRASKGAS